MDKVFDIVIKAYQSLWHMKNYGNTIEIVTPVATINDMFVSVFVTKRGSEYVATDGGWIDAGQYECEAHLDTATHKKIGSFFIDSMDIQVTEAKGRVFYFKKIESIELLPNIVFDMANFINAIVSTSNIQFNSDRQETSFKKKARGFLIRECRENTFEFDKSITNDVHVKFSAISRRNNGVQLINFVSGSTSNYFASSICRSDMNFNMIQPIRERCHVNRTVTLLDDSQKSVIQSPQVQTYYNYLLDKRNESNRVVLWSEQDKLVEALAV